MGLPVGVTHRKPGTRNMAHGCIFVIGPDRVAPADGEIGRRLAEIEGAGQFAHLRGAVRRGLLGYCNIVLPC